MQHSDSHGHGDDHAHEHGHGDAEARGPSHGHGHGHDHAHGVTDFSRAFAIGIGLNIVFVAIEAWYGWRVNSLALWADAGHNLSDVAGLVLAWGGAVAGRRPPTERYSYGLQRASILAAVGNALLLLVAMGSLITEAITRIGDPPAVSGGTVMAVAAIGIAINGATALLFMRGRHGDLNIRGAFLHMAADTLVSVGVVLAGAATWWFGWNWLDPVVSLVIALVILVSSWSLLRQSLRLLFDGVPEHIDLRAVRSTLEALPRVERVHDLHVWATGTSEVAMTAHLVMPQGACDDAFLRTAIGQLRTRHRIGHITLQAEQQPCNAGCQGEPAAATAGAGDRAHATPE